MIHALLPRQGERLGEGVAHAASSPALSPPFITKGVTRDSPRQLGAGGARIGLFIVGSEAVPEAEWWAMAPPGVSVHAARGDGADAVGEVARGSQRRRSRRRSGARREAVLFSTMKLQAVVFAHTSSSVVGGKGWDEATVDALSAIVRAGIAGDAAKVTTNGLDTLAALRHAGVRRPFLVVPPWFPDDTVGAALRYYADHGITPVGHLRLDPGRKWRDVPPQDLYPQGMGFEQEIEPLYAQILKACPAAADGVLIGGTGFRCVGIIDTLERDLGRPVITANQASLWHCLRMSGIHTPIEGYGALLRS